MISLLLHEISEAVKNYAPYRDLVRRFTERRFPFELSGPHGSFFAFLLALLAKYAGGPMVIVVPTEQEARNLVQDLELTTDAATLFPWWGTLPYRGISPQAAVFGERVNALVRLLSGERLIFVTPLRSFLTPLPPAAYLRDRLVRLQVGDSFDPVELERHLESFGYLRVPRVSVKGEFALRGEVLDVYLPGHDEATRVVFEFDTVEEIRFFDPLTQSSTGAAQELVLEPVKEVSWNDERIDKLAESLQRFEEFSDKAKVLIEDLRERRTFKGEEIFFPLSFDEPGTLLDYLPEKSTVFLGAYERLQSGYETLRKEYMQLYRQARQERREVPRPARVLVDLDEVESGIRHKISVPLMRSHGQTDGIHLPCEGPRSFFGNVVYLKEELSSLTKAGYKIFVFAESQSQSQRIEYLLKDFPVQVFPQSVNAGFSLPDLQIMVIQENEIFGRRKRVPRSVKKAESSAIDSFVDLSPGDFVVHVNYGIGRFLGIRRMQAAGNERDYIHLEYAAEEMIYTPIEQVNLIQRYIGQEGREPRLDKIGGKSWESRKNRVRKSVEDLADRLIKLYSRRKQASGYAFPTDTDWQMEFEAAFPYQETQDQLTCIDDVKADMEAPAPMDRLVCGDVGYGKTEVAMRAAFKAVTGGKQAAFLAPTTILVEQHYENFVERFGRYPVKIEMLSRFVSKGEQRRVVEELKKGQVDLVIGTHRLLQRDVRFKNLGLLIVDEEQRFGVKDKERLKELKTNVDSLTLTATPIPRTLHMSLLKIRDMSVLTTPPQNRRPIETTVDEFSEELVADAIRREVAREGQIYYLHNRVETLDSVQNFIQRLVPEVLVECAHGQMSSHELEDIMHRFIHGAFHVLVSTTIIENGIDIPNVNTIIIDRADMYGISQLYQLRGRVGRSERVAFAYLFYPERRALSEIAMKRLQIISDYTELGSGFKIALKDLEVRGAGNLLGREQSGDILSVGFDMYLRLLDQAIRELSEKPDEEEAPEVYMELDYSGYIPDEYISDASEKMEVYKRIAAITVEEELERVFLELQDRFGPLPDAVGSLLALAEIRIICRRLFVSSVKERGGFVEVEFSKVSKVSAERVLRLIQEGGGKVKLDPKRPNILILQTGSIGLKEKSEFIRERLSLLSD